MNDFEKYLHVIRQTEHQDWFLLCVDDEIFQCVSAGPLDLVKNAIRNIRDNYFDVREYCSYLHQSGAFNAQNRYPLCAATYKAVYDDQEGYYDKVVREVLNERTPMTGKKRKLAPVKPNTTAKKTLIPKVKHKVAETSVKRPTIPKVAPKAKSKTVFKRKVSKARLSYEE